jgi:NADPH2:quinone reductase
MGGNMPLLHMQNPIHMQNPTVMIAETGSPAVMQFQDMPQPVISDTMVLIEQSDIGINFIDTYHRSGLYPLPSLPHSIGMEAAGIVVDVGKAVTTLKRGDRVAYCGGVPGAYTKFRAMPAAAVVKIPETISETSAVAASLLKGLTAEYLVRRTYNVKANDWVLVHAAAGGVGQIIGQWLKHIGANIIGTASTAAKIARAQASGYDHVIDYTQTDIVDAVRDITNGAGVHVVYDGVGRDTFKSSLDCLRPRGWMVSFGNASGPVPAVNPLELTQRGSVVLTRPSLMHFIADPVELHTAADYFLELLPKLDLEFDNTHSLADIVRIHQDLENRKTQGSIVAKV